MKKIILIFLMFIFFLVFNPFSISCAKYRGVLSFLPDIAIDLSTAHLRNKQSVKTLSDRR